MNPQKNSFSTVSRFEVFPLIFYIAALGMLLMTVLRYIDTPFRGDESDFFNQVKEILRYGVPKMPFGEGDYLFKNTYFGYDAYYGMWHPPLFLYSASLLGLILGVSNAALRLTGFLCFLGSIGIVWKISQKYLDKNPFWLQVLPAGLIMLTPFLMEGSLYFDIDNTSLNFFILLYLWAYLHIKADHAGRIFILPAIVSFSFCSKLTTPWMALAATALYEWNRSGFKKSFMTHLVMTGCAAIAFAVFYMAYCALFNYPASFMFEFSYWGRVKSYTAVQNFKSVLHAARWFVMWVSPVISALLLMAAAQRLIVFKQKHKFQPVDLFLIFSYLSFFSYLFLQAKWGKYAYPAVFSGVLAVGLWVSSLLSDMKIQKLGRLLSVAGAVLLLQWFFAQPLQVKPPSQVWSLPLSQIIFESRNLNLFFVILLAGLFMIAAQFCISTQNSWGRWAAAGVIALLVFNPMNQIRLMAAPFERSPFAPHIGNGFQDTVDYLNQHFEADIILCPKDVGSYFNGRYYSTDENQSFWTTPIAEATGMGIRIIVDSKLYPTLEDRAGLSASSEFRPFKEIGEFVIYRSGDVIDEEKDSI